MRKLVAALACRNNGSRLYGKPLQYLDVKGRVHILEHMVRTLETVECIESIVLGVSEGPDNHAFVDYARERGLDFIIGHHSDVLRRLIECTERAGGTDTFRVTTESPFIYYEDINEAWRRHLANNNDVTVTNGLPEGCHFEIFTLESLKTSHREGTEEHRSEMCSRFVNQNRDRFQLEILPLPAELERYRDLRLTVDNPEDLVVCRSLYMALKEYAPLIPIAKAIEFLDSRPDLKELLAPFIVPKKVW